MQSTTATIALGLTYFASIVAAIPHAYPMPRPYPKPFVQDGDACPVDGVMRCTASNTWTVCDHGKLADMGNTADGMECVENGDGTASMVRATYIQDFTDQAAAAAAAARETIQKLMDGTLDWSVQNQLIGGGGIRVFLEPVEGWTPGAAVTVTAPTDETVGTDDTAAPSPVDETVVAPAESSGSTFVTSVNPTAPADEGVTSEEVAAPVVSATVEEVAAPSESAAVEEAVATEENGWVTPVEGEVAPVEGEVAPVESATVEEPVATDENGWVTPVEGEVAPVESAPVEETVATEENGWVLQGLERRREERPKVGCMTFYIERYGPYYAC